MVILKIEEKPPGAPPFDTVFEQIGGEAKVRALIERFYDLMDLDPAYMVLRAVHGDTLDNARQRLLWFQIGWTGGPQHYTDRFGNAKLSMRDMPFKIGTIERDQCLACMCQAMEETSVDPNLRKRLEASFFQTADWMRNQKEKGSCPV